jgi:hypothetical protein
MARGETSCAKRARLLFPNQNDTDSDSDDAWYTASSREGEEVEQLPPLIGYPSSHIPSSPDFSASTSEDEEAVQDVAGQQPPPPYPRWGVAQLHRIPQRVKQ